MANTDLAVRGFELAEKRKEVRRCVSDSWYLATEYLGYAYNAQAASGMGLGLVDRVHRQIFGWYKTHRTDKEVGLWMARGRHKTTMIVTWLLQDILRDPYESHRYFHDDDTLALQFLDEIGSHIRNNDKLRGLDPVGIDPKTGDPFNIFPSKRESKWFRRTDGAIRIKTPPRYGVGARAATLQCQGVRTAVTGAHIDGKCWLDDIISDDTVRNSRVQAVTDWVRHTVYPVVDSKHVRVIGTPWIDPSLYQEFWSDSKTSTLIIPGAIAESDEEFAERLKSDEKKLHFVPDYTFQNPMHHPKSREAHARRQLKDEQRKMKSKFSPQIMIDSEQASEKFWSADCENFTGIQRDEGMPGIGGRGVIFVLSDPAPFLEGSHKNLTEKIRGDGTKDYWSIAVVKFRPRGELLDRILLDGSHSQEWDRPAGANEAARLMKKWRTPFFLSEAPNDHHKHMMSATGLARVSIVRAKDGGPLKFKDYNKADGKNSRTGALAALARSQEFWICTETCPDEFLYGDREHTGMLTQVRKARKVGPGKTNLRFDDDLDVTGRCTDDALLEFSPQPRPSDDPYENLEELDDEDEDYSYRSRYCSA